MQENFSAIITAEINEFMNQMAVVDETIRRTALGATAMINADINNFISSIHQANSQLNEIPQVHETNLQAEVTRFIRHMERVQARVLALTRQLGILTAQLANNQQQFQQTGAHIQQTSNQIYNAGSQIHHVYQGTSSEARQMTQEMRSAFAAQSASMNRFRDQQIEVQYGYFQLARASSNYTGSTSYFMNSLQQLGNRQRQINDQMIANDLRLRHSFMQTVGTMLARSTQASKILANYQRMGNPFYLVNAGALRVADSLNRIANAGQPAAVALRLLGPTASMKQLNDMTMMITQGLMRFQMVAMGAAVTSALLYSALHKGAMETVKGYEKSLNRMTAAVRKAFQPMVDVFGAIMIKVYDFITAIANMVIKFNEAHPVLAKIIQGIMMLIPALTLLLSPLAIGVGLVGGFMAAWGQVWMLIGPLVTGLAAMSATVWLVAAAIVAGVAAFNHFYKTNEAFRNGVNQAIEAVKQFGLVLLALGKYFFWVVADGDYMNDWLTHLPKAIQRPIAEIGKQFAGLRDAVLAAFHGDFSHIGEIFKALFPTILAALVGGIPGLIIAGSRFIPAIAQGITSNAGVLSATITQIANSITEFLTNELPVFVQEGVKIINGIVSGITQALPAISLALVNIITMIIPIVSDLLPVLLNAGIQIVQALIEGIISILPVLIDTGILIIDSLINIISRNLPLLIDSGIKVLNSLIDGVMKVLPQLINTAIKLVTTILDALILNLPKIVDAGIKILQALIDGIVKILPKLIDTAIKLIMHITNALIENLPKIIDAGIKILNALINGIIEILPKLLETAVTLILAIVTGIIENLPKIIDAGIKIIKALIDGLVKLRSQLVTTIKSDVIDPIVNKLKSMDLKEIGMDIIRGLIKGIGSMTSAVWDAVNSITDGIKNAIKGALDIHSPSRWMRDIVGKNIVLGVIVGLEKMNGAAVKTTDFLAKSITNAFTPELAMADIGISRTSIDTGFQMDEIKQQIKDELDVDLWIHQKDRTGGLGDFKQEVHLHSPTPLSPSENARQLKRVGQQQAMEWGFR